jgi:hypothetical protein
VSEPDSPQREAMEKMVFLGRGPKGEKGDTGARGKALNNATRRALIYLFAVAMLLGVANLAWTSHAVRAEQSAQRHQGQLVQRKLCATLESLAAQRPPAGNPAVNPSRAYLQGLHDRLAQLGADVGCPR